MPRIFQVEPRDINDLTDVQLVSLLRKLLYLEAKKYNIAGSSVDVSLAITVPDGGEDGRIRWNGGPESTGYLTRRFMQFQVKATNMGPSDCAKEIISEDGTIKQMVSEALADGAAYVLFINRLYSASQIRNRVSAIRSKLISAAFAGAHEVEILVYDANKISGWVNEYASAIVAVLSWVGRQVEQGLKTLGELVSYEEFLRFQFVADQKRSSQIESIRNALDSDRQCLRVVGTSGLGKTRLVYEALNYGDVRNNIAERVVYVDANANRNIAGFVSDWARDGLYGIVVVDNCDVALHSALKREVRRDTSRMSLITVDYTDETSHDTLVFTIDPLPDDLIRQMLYEEYGETISDLDRVVSFAQGFPLMAVLLARARLEKEPEMGKLTDDDIAKRMLWGGRSRSEVDEQILQAFALFERFGFKEEVSAEYRFIVDHILGMDGDVVYRCVKQFIRRRLIDERGRYLRVVPKPLAIRLAADWWRDTRPEKQLELIESSMPRQLADSFCDQVAKLDFMPEVKAIAQELCGDQGPFGRAEVILSEQGSRLFRSFVEVDPVPTSKALLRVLSSLDVNELKKISSAARRNVVSALERICYHENCFYDAAWCLLLLASAETESWDNNSTNLFVQLFRVYNSGTSAAPALRIKFADDVLAGNNDGHKLLIASALSEALDTFGKARLVGAEYQGSGLPLEEWKPKFWGDIFSYWERALSRLTRIAVSNDKISRDAMTFIANNIRGLIMHGQLSILDNAIKTIVGSNVKLWPEAVSSIKLSLKYDCSKFSQENLSLVKEWLVLLDPDIIQDKLSLYVINAPYEHEEVDGEYVDLARAKAERLAEDISTNIEILLPYVSSLMRGEQRQSYAFGRKLVVSGCPWGVVVEESVRSIIAEAQPNLSFFLGLLNGLYEVDPGEWDRIVADLANNDNLIRYYADFANSGRPSLCQLKNLVALIRDKKCDARSALTFMYGRSLSHLMPSDVVEFALALFEIGSDCAWISFSILSMYCYSRNDLFVACRSTFADFVFKVSFSIGTNKFNIDYHLWLSVINLLLKDSDAAFSEAMAKFIVDEVVAGVEYRVLMSCLQPALIELLRMHAKDVWSIFSRAIFENSGVGLYRLVNLFGAVNTFDRAPNRVLANVPDSLLKKWCSDYPDKAPEFVARVTDVFLLDGDRFILSERATFLIDVYGSDDKVLSALTSNISTFGHRGLLSTYYANELTVFLALARHTNDKVKKWSMERINYLNKVIAHEKEREAERDMGIY